MLSVTQAASLLDISPSRLRSLIASDRIPAEKVGHAWTLREEDVMQRLSQHPRAGRPTKKDPDKSKAASSPAIESCDAAYEKEIASSEQRNLHGIYIACKEAFSLRPSATDLEGASDETEASFYIEVADFFLQQKQKELIRRGVY